MQSVLKRFCQSTIVGGASVRVTSHRQTARFEKGVMILVDKKKTLGGFLSLYAGCVVYKLVKVHVALYDPFKVE